MISRQLFVIILAAGKGTRMKSDKAKVLHEVFFAPMVQHVVNAVLPLNPVRTVVVVGHQRQAVEQVLQGCSCTFALQTEQLGTGHAVLAAEKALGDTDSPVMILCGDTPLIRPSTLEEMFSSHIEKRATLSLMTTVLDDPTNYGRILTDSQGRLQGIIEQKDGSCEQLAIQEINAGIYCVDKTFLFDALKKVGTNNSQNEVYLTDIVQLAVEDGLPVEKFTTPTPSEVLGVNSRVELADAHLELQLRRNRQLMLQGVTMYNPETITISPDSHIGRDTVIEPGVRITGGSRIGEASWIGQGSILHNCSAGDKAVISPYCCMTGININSGQRVPPFSSDC